MLINRSCPKKPMKLSDELCWEQRRRSINFNLRPSYYRSHAMGLFAASFIGHRISNFQETIIERGSLNQIRILDVIKIKNSN